MVEKEPVQNGRPEANWRFAAVVVSILVIVRLIIGPQGSLMLAAGAWVELIVAFAALTTGLRVRSAVLLVGGAACGLLACCSAPAIEQAMLMALALQILAGVIGIGAMTREGWKGALV